MRRTAFKIQIYVALIAATACGSAGEGDSSKSCFICNEMDDMRGSIASQDGRQSQLNGWILTLFEREAGIARVGEIDSAGIYEFSNVRTDVDQTIGLLSPNYVLQSVLSMPSENSKNIHQFFKPTSAILPKLIYKGPIIVFANTTGVIVNDDVASDEDGDNIPDGASIFSLSDSGADTDLDGIPNEKDPDIDGDGIINVLDTDADGDGILDVFDGDANGNLINDSEEDPFHYYFNEGVKFTSVQYLLKPKESGSGNEANLIFTARIRDGSSPSAVKIRGAPSLLDGANIVGQDSTGNDKVIAWNRLLADDGSSDDEGPNDGLYAQKVVLAEGKAPKSREMVFFQLTFGGGDKVWHMEFPYIFPDVKLSIPTTTYQSDTRRVSLSGDPFGEVQDFVWFIKVSDKEGRTIWSSQSIPGTTRQFAIPKNIVTGNEDYGFEVISQTLDKLPGRPSYVVQSGIKSLE